MSSHQHPQFGQLPYLETVDDVARFIINMSEGDSDIYMPGIRVALDSMKFSQPQIGLLDRYASPRLSASIEKYLCGRKTEAISAHLENAFWAPMIAFAQNIIDPEPMGDLTHNQARNLSVLLLYATMQAGLSNMNLMLQMNAPNDGKQENSSVLAAQYANTNVYQVYEGMPASHILRVLQKGVVPQFIRAIEQETGVNAKDLASAQRYLYTRWAAEPTTLSGNKFLRPLDSFQWMRFSKPDADFIQEEIDIAKAESRKLLPPPSV